MKILLVAAVAAFTLVACGSESDTRVADDPTATPTSTASATPEPSPTVGTYPTYEPTDYTYTLVLSCFCPSAGLPVRVSVEDGEVTDAVYAKGGRGVKKGDPAEEFLRLTINDIIAAANNTGAASVQVTWPAGQDYPTSVFVDQDEMMADEETGYRISDVVVA